MRIPPRATHSRRRGPWSPSREFSFALHQIQQAIEPHLSLPSRMPIPAAGIFADVRGHVFRTINGGAQWKDIGGNLPNTPVNAIVINPSSPSEIFVGTDIGVFYTTSGGVSWATLNVGLPRVAVLGLALHSASNTLRTATHGRSVWDMNISAILPIVDITSISPSSANHGGSAFALTVNGGSFDSSLSCAGTTAYSPPRLSAQPSSLQLCRPSISPIPERPQSRYLTHPQTWCPVA
jgi:hypothetical protein